MKVKKKPSSRCACALTITFFKGARPHPGTRGHRWKFFLLNSDLRDEESQRRKRGEKGKRVPGTKGVRAVHAKIKKGPSSQCELTYSDILDFYV